MVHCEIRNGRVWLVNPSEEERNRIGEALAIKVPGAEHTFKYKTGQWDGVKHLFNWQHGFFSIGLKGLVERRTGYKFLVEVDDRSSLCVDYLPFSLVFSGKEYAPRIFQETATRDLLANKGGLAHMATNAGKTGVIAGIALAYVKQGRCVVVLESRVDLCMQVRDELAGHTHMKVGIITSLKQDPREITVVMVPTAYRAIQDVAIGEVSLKSSIIAKTLQDAAAFLVDEVHHAISESYRQTLAFNVQAVRYGFSGTIAEEDSYQGMLIRELFGDVLARVTNAELIEQGISACPKMYMVEYSMDIEAQVKYFKEQIHGTCFKWRVIGYDLAGNEKKEMYFSVPMYTNKVREYVMNYSVVHYAHFRDLLKSIVDKHADKTMVIMVDWIDFANDIAPELGARAFHGSAKDRDETLAAFKLGKIKRIVATSILDEGLSIDAIEVLVLATVGRSTRQFLQRIGRGLRKKAGENVLTVYDFFRYGHEYLVGPSKDRYQLWKSEGFDVTFVEEGNL